MGGPCLLLELRQIVTHKVLMKGTLPRLVRWARRDSTRDICPALAALVRPVQNIFFPPHTSFTSFVPIAQRAGQAVVPVLSLKYVSLV
jgi:hypothetical protein